MNSERFKQLLAKYIPYSIIGFGFVYVLRLSWCRWGDLIIDTFTDPVVAHKLVQGKILFKDIYYMYGGILPPHILAFLNKIFGVTLATSAGLGIALTLVCCFFVYRIARLYLSRELSTLVTLTFLAASFNLFGEFYTDMANYILPYRTSTEWAITFILAALFFFMKYVLKRRTFYLYAWIVPTYLLLLTRFDMSLTAYTIFVVFGISLFVKNKKLFMSWVWVIPAAMAFITYFLYLKTYGTFTGFLTPIRQMMSLIGKGNDPLQMLIFGIYDLLPTGDQYIVVSAMAKNILLMFLSFLAQILFVASLSYVSSVMANIEEKYCFKLLQKIAVRCIFTGSAFILLHIIIRPLSLYQFRAVPLFVFAGIVICFVRLKDEYARYFSLLVLFFVSFGLMGRILLKASVSDYGAYYLVPGIIAYYVVVVNIVPSLLKNTFDSGCRNIYFKTSMILFMVIFGYPFVTRGMALYQSKNMKVNTERGTFISYNTPKSQYFWDTVYYLRDNTSPEATVVVLPEGSGINYFSKRESPVIYDNFTPNYFNTIGEDKIVQGFKSCSIDYIVLVHRPCFEFGYSYFGIDFGKKLWQWVFEEYEPVKQFGVFPGRGMYNEFGILVMKKKNSPRRS
jgi:hypothetical protein